MGGMRSWVRSCLMLSSLLLVLVSQMGASSPGDKSLITLAGPAAEIARHATTVKYDLDLSKERYFIFVPSGYTGKEPYGLVVYTSPGKEMAELPTGWKAVLERRKLIFLAAQSAGNDRDSASRCGLAVLGATIIKQKYSIDPARVYAAGFSGGARVSGQLGFYHPEMFHGTIQACGADFYEAVPQVHPVAKETSALGLYGVIKVTPEEVEQAKPSTRFVFITGAKDFRYADIQNIYEGGFSKSGFKAKLIDVPGMGHDDCGAKALVQALDFIEEGTPGAIAPTTAPAVAAPAWLAQPVAKWPLILLELDIQFKDKTQIAGASGFLMRLPNGAVVAATAKHAACDEKAVDAFESSLKAFKMHPRTLPQRSVTMRKAAILPPDAKKLDCLLMRVGPGPCPVEVRPARDTPAEEGEAVYLVAVPYGQRAVQNVYKGTVRKLLKGDAEFAYEIEGKVDSSGFSGAPVLDATGSIVGLHLGKVKYDDGTEYMRAVNVSSMVPVCTAPAAPKPPARAAPSAKPAASPTSAPRAGSTE